ncbi:MAG TPA: hypothetical protein VF122_03485 [Caulobacteraceae bacterium]
MHEQMTRVAVCAIALATAAATAASAETRLRVRNDSAQPAEITVDKKSRDVRPRKASNFPLTSPTADLKVAFANGDVNYGEIDVGPFLPVQTDEGDTYYCMTLDTEDFNILPQEICAEWVKK